MFRCAVDLGTLLRNCRARFSVRLNRGPHVLRVQAVDPAGNHSLTTQVEVKVT
jgi:hypothetical protein